MASQVTSQHTCTNDQNQHTKTCLQRLMCSKVCADGSGDECIGSVDEEASHHHEDDVGGKGSEEGGK